MTSNIAYAHLINQVPFIAHEGCKAGVFRETSGAVELFVKEGCWLMVEVKMECAFLGGEMTYSSL